MTFTRRFLARDAVTVAKALIGCRLVRTYDDGSRAAGVIVETEAYCGAEDRAAHSFNNHRSARNESMYAAAGTCYVYFTYGMHHCMNVVCGAPGEPVAVLIRALEPAEGIDRLRAHRDARRKGSKPIPDHELCAGPARLCQALAIDRALDGLDLTLGARLWLEGNPGGVIPESELECTARVGVDRAGDWAEAPQRWFLRGSRSVSPGRPSRRREA